MTFYSIKKNCLSHDWQPDGGTRIEAHNEEELQKLIHFALWKGKSEVVIRCVAKFADVDLSILVKIQKDATFRLDPKADSETIFRLARFFYPAADQDARINDLLDNQPGFGGGDAILIGKFLADLRKIQKVEWKNDAGKKDHERHMLRFEQRRDFAEHRKKLGRPRKKARK